MKKSNQGFTLIELIIVIVILGILAVTAAPKFLDLTGDARASTVEALEGSIKGAANIVFSKAIIAGQTSGSATLDIDNNDPVVTDNVSIVNGYPSVLDTGIDRALELETGDYTAVRGTTIIRFYPTGVTAATVSGDTFSGGSNCFVSYTQSASAGARPAIASDVSNCSN